MVPLYKIVKTFLLFFLLFSNASCFDYEDSKTPGVKFSTSASGTMLEIEENNNGEKITLLKVTNIGGKNLIPDLSTITPSLKDRLDIKLEKVIGNDDVMLLMGRRLDFEKLDEHNTIRFGIYGEGGGSTKDISLKILNIDDENPQFTVSTGCTMTENKTITIDNIGEFSKHCNFNISDPDGWLNKIDFKGITNPAASELFSFQFKTPPGDEEHSFPVYLVLNKDKLLDYEKVTMYMFDIEVKDGNGHPTVPTKNVQILVKVEDINDTPPMWVTFMPTIRIKEKQKHTINVVAKDGDFGINDEILYKLTKPNEFVSIHAENGTIDVSEINRDVGPHDIVSFSITAYEKHAPDWNIADEITLIIEDVDDNIPKISIPGGKDDIFYAEIAENKTDPVNAVITIEDIDLGQNAMYHVELIDIPETKIEYSKAFQIIPNDGYQKGQFSLNVKDVSKLDYDSPNEDWRQIRFKIRSQEKIMKNMSHEFEIRLNLTDWNDEWPIFEKSDYVIELKETIPIGQIINKDNPIKATDRDSVDKQISHTLVGTMAESILVIDPEGGFITTKKDRSFDHEKEPEVLVQIRAVDKANHIAQTQLKIKVLDVNDKTPQISVEGVGVTVKENQKEGYELPFKIRAIDEDSNPDLHFSIDWEKSYVTKNAVKLKNKPEFQWLRVDTVPITKKEAQAKLIVTPTKGFESSTPDYEVYDTSYIALNVIDSNTEVGIDSSSTTLVITIENINDNPPIFTESTKHENRTVTEGSRAGTIIGVVTATDADKDTIEYSLEPKDDKNIEIDSATGQLRVKTGANIDCDGPLFPFYKNVTILAKDGDPKHIATQDIAIYIIDVNDEIPKIPFTNQHVSIQEDNQLETKNSNGITIYSFKAEDNDRDDPNNAVRCQIDVTNDPDVKDRFDVDPKQGNNDILIIVKLSDKATLDREIKSEYKIQLYCIDNPDKKYTTTQNPSLPPPPIISLTLTDVNDNYPEVEPDQTFKFSEIDSEISVGRTIQGSDKDVGDNGKITFSLLKVEKFKDSEYKTKIVNGNCNEGLFAITTDEPTFKNAKLRPKKTLKNCYGFYILTIKTVDHGNPPLERNDNTVKVEISKWNYKAPAFIRPSKSKDPIVLSNSQNINQRLRTYKKTELLEPFEATDQQTMKGDTAKFNIKISISNKSQFADMFHVFDFGNSSGELQLSNNKSEPNKKYDLILLAEVQSTPTNSAVEADYSSEISFSIQFFDYESPPTFTYTSMNISFQENTTTQVLSKSLKYPATYPANVPALIISYFLEGHSDIFGINIDTGNIELLRPEELDYENQKSYDITLQASNGKTPIPNIGRNSQVSVHISVVDINDNPPNFEKRSYFATIVTGGASDKTAILQVKATDKDSTSQGKLVYKILSIVDSSQNVNTNHPEFEIGVSSGDIKSNFLVSENAKGHFTLKVEVHDEWVNHTDRADVLIYIVSKENTVRFRFDNTQTQVTSKASETAAILNAAFKCMSNMEVVKVNTDAQNITTAPFYFVNETAGKPKESNEILRQVANTGFFNQLKRDFNKIDLILLSFDTDGNNDSNTEELLRAWLIGVSVVLGVLCVALLVAFVLRTRSLNNRIKNLSSTKFGSQESGLNRIGIAAPTTNKHAVEGSNPVYQNDEKTPDFDRMSVGSGDSGLIGVEDNGEFDYHYPTRNDGKHSTT